MSAVTQFFRAWQQRYLSKHLPATDEVQLHQHQLFVFPTPLGFYWLGLAALCYLLGTNYQNNLILLLGYWLLSLWLLCIVLAFRNLHRLAIRAPNELDVQAGQPYQVPLQLSRTCTALHISIHDAPPLVVTTTTPSLLLSASKRGVLPLPRFKIWSDYPLGLIRCWTYPQLTCQIWLTPVPHLLPHLTAAQTPDAQTKDSVDGARAYQHGDPLRHVDWPRLARQQRLVVRTYSGDRTRREVLLEGHQVSEELASHFAAIVQQAKERKTPLALRLPHQQLPADSSATHYRQLLRALAAWC